MSLSRWRTLKLYREFAGPGGQPDPSGVDAMPPMAGPSAPTMGTQPGMTFQDGGETEFRQVYDDFLERLRKKSPKKAKKIWEIVRRDVTEILSQKGVSDDQSSDE